MKLHSNAFPDDGMIPTQYTCAGSDISPPLRWDPPPEGTQSLALIVDDPDAPAQIWVHWVLYNLPPDTRELPENFKSADGIQEGSNDFRRIGYGGPCPPSGTHRYQFKLYALDTTLDLPEGATKEQVLDALQGHVLDHTTLFGKFSK